MTLRAAHGAQQPLVAHERVYIGKWVVFACSALIQACAGLSYSFSVYAPTIKDALQLSQTQIALVGSAVNLGQYFALIAGSIYDALERKHRLGPRLVLWLGCLCCFCGYMGLYLLASGAAPGSFALLVLFAACAGNAGTWWDTAALVTSVRNFPNERGFVVGVLKSFLGLSASLYASIYVAAFEPDATRYLLMLATLPPVACGALAAGVNFVPYVEASEISSSAAAHGGGARSGSSNTNAASSWLTTQGRFAMAFLLVVALSLYQMASAVAVGRELLGPRGRWAVVAGMFALLSLIALVPWRAGGLRAVYGRPYAGAAGAATAAPSGGGGGSNTDNADGAGLDAAGRALRARRAGGGNAARAGRAKRVSGGGTAAVRRVSAAGSDSAASSDVDDESALGAPLLGGGGNGGAGAAVERALLLQHHLRVESPPPSIVPSSPPLGDAALRELSWTTAAGSDDDAGSAPPPPPPSAHARLPDSVSTAAMLSHLDFWLLFCQFCVGTGCSLAYLNNLGQLVTALGGPHDGQVVFVSLFSVANAAGRLLMGYLPEQQLHARAVPRTAFLAAVALTMAAVMSGAARAPLSALAPVSLLLGLCFGAHWSLLPAIISDMFGLSHFAANYAALQVAPALGSLLLATRLTGEFYDDAARRHGDPHSCVGADCFGGAFQALALLATASALASAAVAARSAPAYRSIHLYLRRAAATA